MVPLQYRPYPLCFHACQPPKENDLVVVRIDAMAWGKGSIPPLHLLCTDTEGRRLRFRYYPGRKDFAGVSLRTYGEPDTTWLFGYIGSESGAADVICAISWNIAGNHTEPDPGLDSIIRDATKHSETGQYT